MIRHTIACVLKTGKWDHPGQKNKTVEYGPEHVRWLKAQVEKACPVVHRFVCLSDIDVEGVETVPLKHNWPGWWSKMELFRNDLDFNKVFYLDLDTVLTGSITSMVKRAHHFSVLRNLSRNKGVGSGVMAWHAPQGHRLYNIFSKDAEKYMADYVTSARWGDQGFLQEHLRRYQFLQDAFPKQMVSYTMDMNKQGDPPPDTRIVIFHGKLKPWEVEASWIPPLP